MLTALCAVGALAFGDVNLRKGMTVYVDYNQTHGLKEGTEVLAAGLHVGTVMGISYHAGHYDEDLGRPVFVRVEVFIEDHATSWIREDTEFLVVVPGFVGDPNLEAFSVDPDSPVVGPDHVFRGTDPPTLAEVLESVNHTVEGFEQLSQNVSRGAERMELDQMVNDIARFTGDLNDTIAANEEDIDQFFANLDESFHEFRFRDPDLVDEIQIRLTDARELGESLNAEIGTGRDIRRILVDAERATNDLRDDIDVLTDAREAVENFNRDIGGAEYDIGNTIHGAADVTDNLREPVENVTADIHEIVEGEGLLGRLVMDDTIYLDAREYFRELRIRPWRAIWRE